MRITICMKRALLLTVPVVLCIAALACGTSSPPMQPSPAPDAAPKAAQAALSRARRGSDGHTDHTRADRLNTDP